MTSKMDNKQDNDNEKKLINEQQKRKTKEYGIWS
jgi:hypothetical protein